MKLFIWHLNKTFPVVSKTSLKVNSVLDRKPSLHILSLILSRPLWNIKSTVFCFDKVLIGLLKQVNLCHQNFENLSKAIILVRFLNVKVEQYSTLASAVKSTNFAVTLWILPSTWTRCTYFDKLHGQALNFVGIPAKHKSSKGFFCEIQNIFPRSKTTKNKPFLKTRQQSLAVKNLPSFNQIMSNK